MDRSTYRILSILLLTVTWSGIKGQTKGGIHVCEYTVSVSEEQTVRKSYACGLRMCTRYETAMVDKAENRYKCCENWMLGQDDPYNCVVAICDQRRGELAGTCQNGGTCVEPGHCTCPQAAGFNIYDCSDINECNIQKGGCSHDCVNAMGSFLCTCPEGWGLMDKRTCRPSCHGFVPAGSCPNWGRCKSTNVCSCRPGFQGDLCDDIDECADPDTMTCGQLCVNTIGGYYCQCNQGYELINEDDCEPSCFGLAVGTCPNEGKCVSPNQCECLDGFLAPNCADKNECELEEELCYQNCTNLPGSYKCSCDEGYTLSLTSTIPGYCEPTCYENETPSGCLNDQECVGVNECKCSQGFQGPRCQDVDECASNQNSCEQLCENLIGSFRCQCEDGYELSADGNSCTPVCYDGVAGQCPNGGTCVEPDRCDCLQGYSSPNCTDMDECEDNLDDCEQICVNTMGSFGCQCRGGFQLADNTRTCLALCFNEAPGMCPNGGHCVAPDECECAQGFEAPQCHDMNECSVEGTCSQRCVNTVGSYRCACFSGYAKDQNDDCRAVCGEDLTPGQCMNGGVCLEPDICECYNGFSGSICQVSNQCEINNGGCSHECLVTANGMQCACRPGYGLTGETHCEAICSDELSPGLCMNGGVCIEPDKCRCETGYRGDLCRDVRYCGDNKGGCSDDCVEIESGFLCACPLGYQLLDEKNCGDADECDVFKPCEEDCVNTVGSYTCHCKEGYDLVNNHDCEDRDECQNNPCIQLCENTPGSYVCKCREDHILSPDGSRCIALNLCPADGSEVEDCAPLCTGRPCLCPPSLQLHSNGKHCIDPCVTKPCQHGGMCLANWDEGYRCACWDAGYMGVHCETGIISMPSRLKARVGEIYPNIHIQAKPEQEIIFTLTNHKNKLKVNPSLISVLSQQTTTFDLLVNKRGQYNVTFDISGPSSKDFENNKTVFVRADDVFSRLSLRNKTLPAGCFWYELLFQGQQLWFSSTSYWYRAMQDSAVYTYGVVMLVHGDLSLPISSDGTHIQTGLAIELNVPQFSKDEGVQLENDKNVDCQELFLSARDMKEFRESRSLFWSLFINLETIVPYYIQLSPVDEISDEATQFKPQILSGSSIQNMEVCRGAPVNDNGFYLVFNFQDPFFMAILEEKFLIPEGDSCIIIDLFSRSDPTATFLFSEKGGAKFRQMTFFQTLEEELLMEFFITGLSVSRAGNIRLPPSAGKMQFWNGVYKFKYPFAEKAVVWSRIAMRREFSKEVKSFDFKLSASMQAFLSNINPEIVFTHLFVNAREVFLELEEFNAYGRVKIFGKQRTFQMFDILNKRYAVVAMGADGDRIYCGEKANPPGVFVRVSVEANLLQGTPILEDIILSTDNELYFFKTFAQGADKRTFSTKWQNQTLLYISALKDTNRDINNILRSWQQQYSTSEIVQYHFREMIQNSENISQDIELITTAQDFSPLSIADFTKNSTRNFASLQRIYRSLRDLLSIKLDSSLDDILERLSQPISELRKQSGDVVRQMYEATLPFFPNQGTWGLKGSFGITVLGMLFQLDGEFVLSDENMMPCRTRFSEFYEHLRGEKAIRVLGIVSWRTPMSVSALSWGPLFWKYLTPKIGFGIEVALSPDRFNFVCRLHVEWSMFGLKVAGDIIVSTKGIAASVEANLWNIFRARLTVGAAYSLSPADWSVWVQADFLPGGENSFQGSLWDAVRKAAKNFGETADKRLQSAESGLEFAKASLSQSQEKVEKAKQAMLSKKSLLDQAISKLEQTKVKLENAKAPFKAANNQLTDMQNKVDRMCQIKSCESVCVRGLKFVHRCPYLWYAVPCLVTSKCAFRVKSPRCTASNFICKVKRGVVYAALGIAKAAIRIPMLALDVAKAGVTAGQIILDKSRILFDIAGGFYDGAKLALKGAEFAAGLAQKGISKLRIALKAGLSLLDAFVKNKLQTLIDFKECGFKNSLSAADGMKMEMYCNVNFMSSGWKYHRFVIDFTNVLSSLWKMAQHYLNKVMQQMNIGKRKKREVTHAVLSNLHRIFRRESNTTNGVELDTTIKFWETQCKSYKPAISFIKDSLVLLLNISHKIYQDTSEAKANSTSYFEQFDIKSHVNDIASEPDSGDGYAELGISTRQVEDALKSIDVSTDDVGQAFSGSIADIQSLELDTIQTLRNYLIIVHWKAEMENFTANTISHIFPCSQFQDCMVFALGQLDSLFESVEPSLVSVAKSGFDEFKDSVIIMMQNDSQMAGDMPSVSLSLLDDLHDIDASDIFCATMPQLITSPKSSVVVERNTTVLTCVVDALPEPVYQWYHDDRELPGNFKSTIHLDNVTLDHEGSYKCVAENHIGSVTSSAAFLDVQFAPKIVSDLPTLYHAVTGGTHVLTCNVSADPEADVVWYSTESNEPVAKGSSLILSGNDTSPPLLFKCFANNSHGSSESQEIIVTKTTAIPACPVISLNAQYVSVPSTLSTNPILTKNPVNADYDILFKLSISAIVSSINSGVNVEIKSVQQSAKTLAISLSLPCGNISECSLNHCNQMYTSMEHTLGEALIHIRGAIANDTAFFNLNGETYYLKADSVNIGQSRFCPEMYTANIYGICILNRMKLTLTPPRNLVVVSENGAMVVRWSPPVYAEQFVKGYQVTLVNKNDGSRITVNISGSDTSLILDDSFRLEEYDVRVTAFTDRYQSELVGGMFDLAQVAVELPSDTTNSNVGVAVGVSLAFCIILLALAIIARKWYRSKQKSTGSVSSLASTVSTSADSMDSGTGGLGGRKAVKAAWLPLVAGDQVKIPHRVPSTFT